MAGMLRIPRSRGGLSGLLLIVLGVWGGLVPFTGPAFHYGYSPDAAWTMTASRLYLEVLPAAGAVLGGMIVLGSKLRPVATLGACLAAASGAWLAVGRTLAAVWATSLVPVQGTPLGGSFARAIEQIGMFTGLGVAIAFFAALALGRLTVVSARDTANARGAATAGAPAASATAAVPARPAGTAAERPQTVVRAGRASTAGVPAAAEPAAEPSAATPAASASPDTPVAAGVPASGDEAVSSEDSGGTAAQRTPTGAAAP